MTKTQTNFNSTVCLFLNRIQLRYTFSWCCYGRYRYPDGIGAGDHKCHIELLVRTQNTNGSLKFHCQKRKNSYSLLKQANRQSREILPWSLQEIESDAELSPILSECSFHHLDHLQIFHIRLLPNQQSKAKSNAD